jgi:microcystin-dependent protein
MAYPYVGEIRMFAGNFAPNGWEFCAGQLISIAENETLFNLIGTTYGGDGQSTFALPDLRGRLPVHQGLGFGMGNAAGSEQVTLTTDKLPSHTHALQASTEPNNQVAPAGSTLAASVDIALYIEGTPATSMSPEAITSVGGSQPHENRQPYLCVNYIISLFGIFPPPS